MATNARAAQATVTLNVDSKARRPRATTSRIVDRNNATAFLTPVRTSWKGPKAP